MEPPSQDTVDDLRQKGNHEFQQGHPEHAVTFYTLAMEKAQESNDISARIINLCNRSACYYQLQDYPNARDDAQLAWDISMLSNVKSAYRLAKTFIKLNDYKAAMEILQVPLSPLSQIYTQLDPQEKKSFQELMQLAQQEHAKAPLPIETTIKGVKHRPISIREFIKTKSLGVGNFSEIVICQHRVTHEPFALKILEKKTAADLAKRQHPNVYNEILMEARVLMERLTPHPNIVTMYHAFQDYYNLFYLMDLHNTNQDLWSRIRYQGTHMVGCYPSQAKIWMKQLIGAVEHLHHHGIVHRDLKPENILLNERNHVIVIDFGTAKDLIQTDLNGPEFVGTPDFMSPEAVTGFSGMPKEGKDPLGRIEQGEGATHCTDLWALGAICYILLTGECPFWSPSPYLTFLKIKRGLLQRNPWGIPDDHAWDFIHRLMQVKPTDRLGADCYQVENQKVTVDKGYNILRQHKYFESLTPSNDQENPIPSLQDLCVRACAELAKQDALDLDLCDKHPPGDGSSHDMMRLGPTERKSVLHILNKRKLFSKGDETRVLQRFVRNDIEYLSVKARPESRDYVGLTQMNDDEGKPPSARGSADPYAKKDELETTKIVHLTNPLLLVTDDSGGGEDSEASRKLLLKGWKKCIASINRSRPKLVVVSGVMNDKCWKFLARISDSIAVVVNDGSCFYSFWLNGFQGLVLQSSTLQDGSPQMLWIREIMEQCRMAKYQMFCFVDCDPRDLEPLVVKRLTRGRCLLLLGLSKSEPFETEVVYQANETVNDDDTSVKSNDSVEDEQDEWTMKVMGTKENGLRWLSVDEKEEWETSFESVDCQ